MIKDITIGQYIPGDSPFHRADPRTKILLTFAYMIVIFLVNSFMGMLMLSLFTILAAALSTVPVKYMIKGLKPVVAIIVLTTLVNIFMTEGRPISNYWLLRNITYEGIGVAILLSVRLTLLIIGASLLTFTTTPILLTDGIEKLLNPLKRIGLPAHELAMMMTIALRFIPTLLEETDKIMKAQSARGAEFDTGNLVQRAKSFVPVLVPLFVSAFRRADELATAMEARCYRGSEGRTRLRQLKFSQVDGIMAIVTILFTVGLLILEYM